VARKRESDWKDEAERWETAPSNSDGVGRDVPQDDPRCLAWQASDEKLVTTLYAISRGWPNRSWPSMEGGVEVSVEVCTSVGDLAEERSACRCFCISTDLSFQPDQPFILQLCWYFQWKLRMPLSPLRTLIVCRLLQVCFPLL
jgi:hypothetical protein